MNRLDRYLTLIPYALLSGAAQRPWSSGDALADHRTAGPSGRGGSGGSGMLQIKPTLRPTYGNDARRITQTERDGPLNSDPEGGGKKQTLNSGNSAAAATEPNRMKSRTGGSAGCGLPPD